jgi:hypothetical protein
VETGKPAPSTSCFLFRYRSALWMTAARSARHRVRWFAGRGVSCTKRVVLGSEGVAPNIEHRSKGQTQVLQRSLKTPSPERKWRRSNDVTPFCLQWPQKTGSTGLPPGSRALRAKATLRWWEHPAARAPAAHVFAAARRLSGFRSIGLPQEYKLPILAPVVGFAQGDCATSDS